MRRRYDKEFKLNAINLNETSKMKQRDLEKDLGIGAGCLSHWKSDLRGEQKNVFTGNGNPRDEEIAKLKRENDILRQERDILKKALGIFSKAPF